MLYFKMNTNGECEGVTTEHDNAARDTMVCRSDRQMRDLGACEVIAVAATKFSGDLYVAVDSGPNVLPRYDVIRAPKIGDEVSYRFNGDTYPDGKIVAVSKSLKLVTTDTGGKYYRRGETGSWKKDRTWFLVGGHHYEQNPRF